MPRVTHVLKAQKDVPGTDIKKGESYYWWKFRYGGKRCSRTPPKPSQLTQSAFLSQLYDLQERIQNLAPTADSMAEIEDIASELRSLGEECSSNRDNMPESLQDGDTGTLLQERADACDSAADELKGIDLSDFEPTTQMTDCTDCDGTGKELDEHGDETDAECSTCGGSGEVEDEDSEPVNDGGETEDEYWQAKLDEARGVSLDIE